MRRLALLAISIVVAGGVGLIAWYMLTTNPERVAPNVTLDDGPVGDLEGPALELQIADRAQEIGETPVIVEFPGGIIETTAEALGLVVDEAGTLDQVMKAGRSSGWLADFVSWVRGPWRPRAVTTISSFTAPAVQQVLENTPGSLSAHPIEPIVQLADGAFVVVAGTDGSRLDTEVAADNIVSSFLPDQALSIAAPAISTPPTATDTQAQALAEHVNAITEGGLTVSLLGSVGRLSPQTLRQNLTVSGPVQSPQVGFDADGLAAALFRLFDEVSTVGIDPAFEIDDSGAPSLVEAGSAPQGCCGETSGAVIVRALETGQTNRVEIPSVTLDDPILEAWAGGGGVVESVGEFTTSHDCCQARVENIHRIADLVRGQYLLPGESFSINEFVGERTVENGFLPAGVIERGRFTEDVGGGISQFATTMFNAAFFAGLDLDEYQSHSIYISRYPYGREATLSFPVPDLRFTNSTDYPILLWPTYTDTAITVAIYSTAHVEVVQTGQEESPFGECTEVETFRSRTYPDGRVVDDSVKARYRPGEGLDCNGNPTPVP